MKAAQSILISFACWVIMTGVPMSWETVDPGLADAAKGPKLVFDKTTHDFGEISPMGKYSCTFTFKNEGDEILEIKEIRTTCGCTAVDPEKKILSPGESSFLEVKYRSGLRPGNVHKRIIIRSNDTETPSVTLSIRGNLVTDVLYSPYGIRFSDVEVDKPAHSEVIFKAKNPETFKITDIQVDAPYIQCNPKTMPDGRLILEVNYVPGKGASPSRGFLSATIRLKTTSTSYSQISIPVQIRFQKEFEAVPPRLFLYAEEGKGVSRDVIIKNTKGNPFTITKVTSSRSEIKTEIIKNGQVANVIQLTINPGTPKGYNSGMISVHFGEMSLSIPVRATVGRADSPRKKTKFIHREE